MVRVLGVDVDARLLAAWREWIAPERQPFFVAPTPRRPTSDTRREVSPELRDTYAVWHIDASCAIEWLDEATFMSLPRADRARLVRSQVALRRDAVPVVRQWADLLDAARLRSQADGHRFVWWPSLLPESGDDGAILRRLIEADGAPSRHVEVSASTWRRAAAVLPHAEALAGTFADRSGSNCFATVVAAAGARDEAETWMQRATFLDWLAERCRPCARGRDGDPGTVFVWFDGAGSPNHAAVAVGDGWALEKPSQAWYTPRTVVPVAQVLRTNRGRGQRVRRYRLR